MIAVRDWARISCAVVYHNRRVSDIPADLSAEAALLLGIVRDADKLDIMDLVLQAVARDGFSELPGMLPHIGLNRDLTPAVIEEVLKTKTVSIGNLRTVTDFLVMTASWFYDLNHAPARRLAAERNFIGRIERELPDAGAVRELLTDIEKM